MTSHAVSTDPKMESGASGSKSPHAPASASTPAASRPPLPNLTATNTPLTVPRKTEDKSGTPSPAPAPLTSWDASSALAFQQLQDLSSVRVTINTTHSAFSVCSERADCTQCQQFESNPVCTADVKVCPHSVRFFIFCVYFDIFLIFSLKICRNGPFLLCWTAPPQRNCSKRHRPARRSSARVCWWAERGLNTFRRSRAKITETEERGTEIAKAPAAAAA